MRCVPEVHQDNAQNRERVNVIRMLLAAFEHAQEALGKQAFDAFDSDGANIQPDRHQTVSKETIKDVIRSEMHSRREAAEVFRAGGESKRAEGEDTGDTGGVSETDVTVWRAVSATSIMVVV
jgi:uncharacterized protein YqeY